MTSRHHPKHPPVVPKKYAGQWIAWNHQQTRIIAAGKTFAAAQQAAVNKGETNPLLDKVPRKDILFVGGVLV